MIMIPPWRRADPSLVSGRSSVSRLTTDDDSLGFGGSSLSRVTREGFRSYGRYAWGRNWASVASGDIASVIWYCP